MPDAISILELNQRLSNAIAMAPDVRNVWVTGETSDVRLSGGHCYLELVEKADDGSNRSRIRANIWAGVYRNLSARFKSETGIDFTSGIKIRACVTASYHPSYGMSVTITNIDPSYTAGDAVRRRNEILQRLTAEGIIELNRSLRWPLVPNRIAIISAEGAAGYGDFLNQLFTNSERLRFAVQLFPAVMQGERTVPTVLAALGEIAARQSDFDAVVIIRGGGSTSDLAAFDDYNIAAAIARFPLPVMIGIGHERDITVLDYVANIRVKTPTAAAEHLVERVGRVTAALTRVTELIYQAASRQIAANRELLAHASASLPGYARNNIILRRADIDRATQTLTNSVLRHIERAKERLVRADDLLGVLSPESVLARGFSLTMLDDGTVVRRPEQAPPGTTLTTRLASGSITSKT